MSFKTSNRYPPTVQTGSYTRGVSGSEACGVLPYFDKKEASDKSSQSEL